MVCVCVRRAERRTDTFGLEGDTMSYVCEWERESSRHSAGQRSEMLLFNTASRCNNRAEINDCLCVCTVCVHSLNRSSYNNESHTFCTPLLAGLLWPLLLFYGLTCHDGGMTATLSEREERKWEREGVEKCGFEVDGREGEKWVSVEKEIGDERQTVKLAQRSERETKKDQMCSLSIHSSVYLYFQHTVNVGFRTGYYLKCF